MRRQALWIAIALTLFTALGSVARSQERDGRSKKSRGSNRDLTEEERRLAEQAKTKRLEGDLLTEEEEKAIVVELIHVQQEAIAKTHNTSGMVERARALSRELQRRQSKGEATAEEIAQANKDILEILTDKLGTIILSSLEIHDQLEKEVFPYQEGVIGEARRRYDLEPEKNKADKRQLKSILEDFEDTHQETRYEHGRLKENIEALREVRSEMLKQMEHLKLLQKGKVGAERLLRALRELNEKLEDLENQIRGEE